MRTSSVSQRLRALVDGFCAEAISEAELKELEALLRDDEEARRYFAAYCRMHAELFFATLAEHAVQSAHAPVSRPARPPVGIGFGGAWRGLVSCFSQIVPLSYLVTAVLLAITLSAASLFTGARHGDLGRLEARAAQHSSQTVGTITGLVKCRWGDPRTAAEPAAPVRVGQRFVVASGLVEITYDNRVTVIVQGPAVYEVDARDGGLLSAGRITARVEGDPASYESSRRRATRGAAPSYFTIRTPSAVFTSSSARSGADIATSTEFGVVVTSPEVSRAYVFRGRIAAQVASGAGKRDLVVPVDENQCVALKDGGVGRGTAIIHAVSQPMPGLFARRVIVPIGGDLQQVAWLKEMGTGSERHFAAVGTGKDIDLPPEAAAQFARAGGTGSASGTPGGAVYTCRLSFELPGDFVPSTVMLRARYFAYNYVRAIRLNGHSIAPAHRINPRAIKEGGEFLSREGFVPGTNILEIDVSNSVVSDSLANGGMLWLRPELSGIRLTK